MRSPRHFSPVATVTTLIVLALMAGTGLYRIDFETDIVATLPERDPVIAAARDILRHHPGQDLVAVDLHLEKADPAGLARVTRKVTDAMADSGLFKRIGMQAVGEQMPALIHYLARHLPILFSAADLEGRVAPLLTEPRIRDLLASSVTQLASLEGIGQADLIARDPLALRNLLLAQLVRLSPAPGVRPFQGHLLSADGQHVLVVATPAQPSTDTAFARQIQTFLEALQERLRARSTDTAGRGVSITPVGAYRAALDNEMLARGDTRRIVVFAMVGIALLLFLTFPRPWIGLLAFVPALAGTITALFIMSLLQARLSVLTLGFGGAVISITVDHGIAYLLFLDRSHATQGWEAAREVRAVGLIATLTTVGAFLALSFSGFPVLGEIGRFAALGIGSSFLFVHTVMPRLIPSLPPARRTRLPVLQQWLARLAGRMGMKTFWVGVAVVGLLAVFASPRFQVNLRAMNSVTPATQAAETQVQAVWGRFMERVFVVTHGERLDDLLDQGDQVADLLEEMTAAGELTPGFLPAAFFPGHRRAEANRAAWQSFWTQGRVDALSRNLQTAGDALGFADGAFAPFLALLEDQRLAPVLPDPAYFELLGIVPDTDGSGWRQFFTLKPGRGYQAAVFYERLAQTGTARLFDPVFFADRLGRFLATTFRQMLIVVGASAVILIGFFFCDLILTALALLPLAGAFACTLGILGIAGRPLDIPALMLAIIVLGMGIDYALFTIRAFQRYGRESDPELALFRTTVFLSAASTLVGFGALMSADHAVFKSAGLTSFCGILFSALGAFVLLPPLLRRLYARSPDRKELQIGDPDQVCRAARRRFRHLEFGPRWTAWRKLREGGELAGFPLPAAITGPAVIYPVDGGVEAAWLAEALPGIPIVGADPDPEKVRLATRVAGAGAAFRIGGVDVLNALGDQRPAELVILNGRLAGGDEPAEVLEAAGRCLAPGGRLLIRVGSSEARPTWRRRMARMGPSAPEPYDGVAMEALLRRQGFVRIARETAVGGSSPAWLWADKA
jgi:predicted exporter/SAM-dependent methyltransferase